MFEIPNNPLLKRFAVLAGGSFAGQAMMFITLPIAAQLYTPADFGLLASFSSLVLLVLPAVCLRFDLAIPISRDDAEALGFVALAFMSASVLALSYGLFLFATSEFWGGHNQELIEGHLGLVVLALWAAAMFSILQSWAIRMKKFRDLAISHAVRGLAGAAAQIGFGIVGIGSSGLLLGQSIYMGLGALRLAYCVLLGDIGVIKKLEGNDLARALRKNWRFPIFSTPEVLLNSASSNLPMLLVVALVGIEAGGMLYLAQRLTSIPIGLITGNLSRVYLGEAPERDRQGKLFGFTVKLLVSLFLSALPVAIGTFLFSQPLSAALLGPEWDGVALYLSWLVPAVLLQFSVVPVATVLHIRSKQASAFLLQFSGFVLQVGSVLFCYATNVVDPIFGFALCSALHYAIYCIVVLIVARD